MSWTVPIRQAKFKGVQFDVISVDESFDKAIAEHTYPFVNGADLEDMGLNAQVVRLQAICFGRGYYTQYKKLLAAIQKTGADVLMHPVRGRMKNMLLVSANLRHDADNVNYVTLDLTFKEATPMKPIFVFEHSLLAKIDQFLNLLEDFMDEVMDLWASVMEVVAFGFNVLERISGMWSAIVGCVEQICGLFDVSKTLFKLPFGVSKTGFVKQSSGALGQIAQLMRSAVEKQAFSSSLGVKSAFNGLKRELDEACSVTRLLSGNQSSKITSAAQFFAEQETAQHNLRTRVSAEDMKNLHCALQLISCGVLAKAGAEIIEQQAENLTPSEIEFICQQIRSQILTALNLVRELQDLAQGRGNVEQPNNGVYTACYQLSERLRNMASEIMQMALAAINQKPPLMVREVRFDSCMQQVAFDFYGDYRRSEELLRLNPQIHQPNFIEQGTLLNAYMK